VAQVRRQRGLEAVKLVLITNASRLHHPPVRQVLEVLDANNGEIWAKLDAGTVEYYYGVDRTTVSFKPGSACFEETSGLLRKPNWGLSHFGRVGMACHGHVVENRKRIQADYKDVSPARPRFPRPSLHRSM